MGFIVFFLDFIAENCCETVLKDCYVLLKKMYTGYSKPNGPKYSLIKKLKCPETQKEKREKRDTHLKNLKGYLQLRMALTLKPTAYNSTEKFFKKF